MENIKLPKSNEKIMLTFLDVTEYETEVQFNLPKSIPLGIRRRFHFKVSGMLDSSSSYYQHDYLMWRYSFKCNVPELASKIKEQLNWLDMELLSFNNKIKYAQDELLLDNSNTKYDIALSFAGEDRHIVEPIAEDLKKHSISVFYDEFEKGNLWGKDLSDYFKSTYAENTRYVIPFISEHYPNKDWTNFEFSVAHGEAKKRDCEFTLPVRIDDTLVVGLPSTVGFLDYRTEGKDGIVKAILSKLET